MTPLDMIAYDPRWAPYRGWHDDHRGTDRTPNYLPAVQQNRQEFHDFFQILADRGLLYKCVQLGLGWPGVSHFMLQSVFSAVWTVDNSPETIRQYVRLVPEKDEFLILGDTHDEKTRDRLVTAGAVNVDLLFIDAGHRYEDVSEDYYDYHRLVRPGGVVAFHDALKRRTYEQEIQVWQFLDTLRDCGHEIHVIGDEIGIAWMVRE